MWMARAWIDQRKRIAAGMEPEPDKAPVKPYTVAEALADYLAEYERRGGKRLQQARYATDAHILPILGNLPVGRLTRAKVRDWHKAMADAAPRVRAKRGSVAHRAAPT